MEQLLRLTKQPDYDLKQNFIIFSLLHFSTNLSTTTNLEVCYHHDRKQNNNAMKHNIRNLLVDGQLPLRLVVLGLIVHVVFLLLQTTFLRPVPLLALCAVLVTQRARWADHLREGRRLKEKESQNGSDLCSSESSQIDLISQIPVPLPQ